MYIVKRLAGRAVRARRALRGIALAVMSAAPQAGQYEQPPSFSAAQVLPPNLLQSPYYTIGNHVGLDDFQYVFRVDTKWGSFTVKGADLMRVRAREIAATAKMEEVGDAETVVDAAGRTALKPLATAKDLVTAPGKTIGDTFKGVGNIFGSAGASMSATDPHKEGVVASLTGGATARRKLAYAFGVDPNTSFPPLHDELTRLATANAIGETGVNAGLAFVTGGAGIAISVGGTSRTLRLALRDKTAAQLEKDGRTMLASIGVSGGGDGRILRQPQSLPDRQVHHRRGAGQSRRNERPRDLHRRRRQRQEHRDGLLLSPPGRADRGLRQEGRAGHRVRARGRRADAANGQGHGQHPAGRLSLLVAPARRPGRGRRTRRRAMDHRARQPEGDVATRCARLDAGAEGRGETRRIIQAYFSMPMPGPLV